MAYKRAIAHVTYVNLDPTNSGLKQAIEQALTGSGYIVLESGVVIDTVSVDENTSGTAHFILYLVTPDAASDATVNTYISTALAAIPFIASKNSLVVSSVNVYDSTAEPHPGPPSAPQFPIV